MVLVPKVQWAQRADKLYITIDLQDAKDPKINISNDAEGKSGKISFSGEGRSHATGLEKHQYALDLELYKGVNPEESKISASDRSIFLVVVKADDAQEHWPRLLQSKGKVTNITVDWNKWVDEDEEEEGGKKDDFDMSDLQNFQNFGGGAFGGGLGGGMSGIGNVEAVQDDGDDSDDDDDDDMPPLEQEEK